MYETLTAMANTTTFTELDQLKAMAIVNIFETSRPFGEYGALVVLNDGAGLSYGISQFTHRSGSLHAVVRRYLEMGGRVGRPTLIENVARLRSDSVAAILSALAGLLSTVTGMFRDIGSLPLGPWTLPLMLVILLATMWIIRERRHKSELEGI